MRFNDIPCVSCNEKFDEQADVVVCPKCGSPHHRQCWINVGHCHNEKLHEENFSWEFPEDKKPKEIKMFTEQPVAKQPQQPFPEFTFKNGENIIVCPHCQNLNYSNNAICMKCKKSLMENSNATPENGTQNFNNAQQNTNSGFNDDYSYYKRFGGLRPDMLIEGIPVAELSDFIGNKGSSSYIRKFASMERSGKNFNFNAWAFLFGPIWFFYRKMIKPGLAFLLATFIILAGQTFLTLTDETVTYYEQLGEVLTGAFQGEISPEEAMEKMEELDEAYTKTVYSQEHTARYTIAEILGIINYGVAFAAGFSADAIYKKKIKKEILKTREECSDMNAYISSLRLKGGTSAGLMILGILLDLAASVICMIPEYYFTFSSMF